MTGAEVVVLLMQLLVGVLVADFLSGFVHWLEDAYGREDMPVLGPAVIEPNIRHHYSPLDFTRASYLKRNGPVLVIAACVGLAFSLAGWLNPFAVTLIAVGSQANETHRWAHMPAGAVPAIVCRLQKLGLLLSQRHHSRHHHAPFAVRYCTITNLMNPILDGLKFFKTLEILIQGAIGAERRQDTGKRPATIRAA